MVASMGNIEAAIIAQNVALIDVINSSTEIADNTQHLSEILNAVSGINWTQDQITNNYEC